MLQNNELVALEELFDLYVDEKLLVSSQILDEDIAKIVSSYSLPNNENTEKKIKTLHMTVKQVINPTSIGVLGEANTIDSLRRCVKNLLDLGFSPELSCKKIKDLTGIDFFKTIITIDTSTLDFGVVNLSTTQPDIYKTLTFTNPGFSTGQIQINPVKGFDCSQKEMNVLPGQTATCQVSIRPTELGLNPKKAITKCCQITGDIEKDINAKYEIVFPVMGIEPGVIDFGEIDLQQLPNSPKKANITVTNTGDAPLNIKLTWSPIIDVSSVQPNYLILPGSSTTINISVKNQLPADQQKSNNLITGAIRINGNAGSKAIDVKYSVTSVNKAFLPAWFILNLIPSFILGVWINNIRNDFIGESFLIGFLFAFLQGWLLHSLKAKTADLLKWGVATSIAFPIIFQILYWTDQLTINYYPSTLIYLLGGLLAVIVLGVFQWFSIKRVNNAYRILIGYSVAYGLSAIALLLFQYTPTFTYLLILGSFCLTSGLAVRKLDFIETVPLVLNTSPKVIATKLDLTELINTLIFLTICCLIWGALIGIQGLIIRNDGNLFIFGLVEAIIIWVVVWKSNARLSTKSGLFWVALITSFLYAYGLSQITTLGLLVPVLVSTGLAGSILFDLVSRSLDENIKIKTKIEKIISMVLIAPWLILAILLSANIAMNGDPLFGAILFGSYGILTSIVLLPSTLNSNVSQIYHVITFILALVLIVVLYITHFSFLPRIPG